MTRLLRKADAAAVQAVALAAGRRFADLADPRIARCADDPPPPAEALEAWASAGRGWVACDGDDVPVGYVVVDLVDGCAHVEEVSVHPDHGGRGIATELLDTVAEWAAGQGLGAMTLTTFADVPWNRPFYERRGWRVLVDEELTPGLVARVADEAAHGLDPSLRVVMRRDLGS